MKSLKTYSVLITVLSLVLVFIGAGCTYDSPKQAIQDTGDSITNQSTSTITAGVEQDVVPMQAGKKPFGGATDAIPPSQLKGETYTRKLGESVPEFGYRTLQNQLGDWKMAHEAVELWAAGAPLSIVVLYQEEGMAAQGFHGYVLVSTDSGVGSQYVKIDLPNAYNGEAYTNVEAVWSQWGGEKTNPDKLFVLVSQKTGIAPDAPKPWYQTFVYEWTGRDWYVNTTLSKELFNLYPAEKVKEKLKQLDY